MLLGSRLHHSLAVVPSASISPVGFLIFRTAMTDSSGWSYESSLSARRCTTVPGLSAATRAVTEVFYCYVHAHFSGIPVKQPRTYSKSS